MLEGALQMDRQRVVHARTDAGPDTDAAAGHHTTGEPARRGAHASGSTARESDVPSHAPDHFRHLAAFDQSGRAVDGPDSSTGRGDPRRRSRRGHGLSRARSDRARRLRGA